MGTRVNTDKEVASDRPDVIIEKKEKPCVLINVAIAVDWNITQKEAENKINTTVYVEIYK
jgi:hypothetical protein